MYCDSGISGNGNKRVNFKVYLPIIVMKMQRLLELEILNLQSVQLGQEFGGWAGTTGSGNKEKEDSLTK